MSLSIQPSRGTAQWPARLDLVGEKWALLAVREVFLGNRRFDEMVRRTGAPRDTLAARLRTLVGAGILQRRQYSEHPARFEYVLTEAGRELYPVILTLMRWGDRHLAGAAGPPLRAGAQLRPPARGRGGLRRVRGARRRRLHPPPGARAGQRRLAPARPAAGIRVEWRSAWWM